MARPVFSSAFVLYTASTPNAAYEVPEGFIAVVRQICITQDVGAYTATVWIQDSEEAPALACFVKGGLGGGNNVNEELRVVVPPGGIISFGCDTVGDTLCAYIGGYLLSN